MWFITVWYTLWVDSASPKLAMLASISAWVSSILKFSNASALKIPFVEYFQLAFTGFGWPESRPTS
jgi:hypothetical protein